METFKNVLTVLAVGAFGFLLIALAPSGPSVPRETVKPPISVWQSGYDAGILLQHTNYTCADAWGGKGGPTHTLTRLTWEAGCNWALHA
jgi:hypothetical protein